MPPPTSAAGIPAILVKIPGTGGAAAATLDGYSMAKQGRGQQALVLTFVASTLGGLVTSIATLFALPYLVRVGYDVHSVEMVVIMLLAGFFGLLLGAMGLGLHLRHPPEAPSASSSCTTACR